MTILEKTTHYYFYYLLEKWWARLGSNQQPPRCQRDALPLSYVPILPWEY